MAGLTDRRVFLGSGAAAAACAALQGVRARFEASLLEPGQPAADDYTLLPDLTYLNHAAIGTVPRPVQDAHRESLRLCETFPSRYIWGDAWEEALARSRAAAAGFVGVEARDLAILRSTTEAFNVLAHGLPLEPGDEVLFSNLNHAGASVCWEHHARARGATVRRFAIDLATVPELTPEQVVALHTEAIGDRTRVLVIPHVDNIVGLRHPVAAIAAAARAAGVEFVLVDGAQAVSVFDVQVGELGVDAYATSAHKWTQAPKGLGWLWTTAALRERLRPLIVTWGQRRWEGTVRVLEDHGTRDLPLILSLGDAVRFQRSRGLEATAKRRGALFDAFRDRVDAEPGLEWASPRRFEHGASLFALRYDAPNGFDAEAALIEHDVAVRAFAPLGQMRVSPNAATTDADVDKFFAAWRKCR